MSNEVVRRDENALTQLAGIELAQATALANSEIVPKQYRGKPHELLAAAVFARSRGQDPIASLGFIHVIEGRADWNAEGSVALVRAAGHSVSGGVAPDGQSATATGTRRDTGDTMSCTWTMQMAQQAGLAGKNTWKQFPQDMLWSRAVDQLCRRLFSDVLMGLEPEAHGAFAGTIENSDRAITAAVAGIDPSAGERLTTATAGPVGVVAVPSWDPAQYRQRAAALTDEFRERLKDEWNRAGLGGMKVESLTAPDEQLAAYDAIDRVEHEAEQTYARRRRHAMAVMNSAGIETDDERHAFVAKATGGVTESVKQLEEGQLESIVLLCVEQGPPPAWHGKDDAPGLSPSERRSADRGDDAATAVGGDTPAAPDGEAAS